MTSPLAPLTVLLVEDSDDDVLLIREALLDAKMANDLQVVSDGEQAMAYLRGEGRYAGCPRPDLVLLDLNLPRKDGREVLEEIKHDVDLRRIPVIVLTTSGEERDILHAYDHLVNAYVQKPLDFLEFTSAVRTIEDFWLALVKLPKP